MLRAALARRAADALPSIGPPAAANRAAPSGGDAYDAPNHGIFNDGHRRFAVSRSAMTSPDQWGDAAVAWDRASASISFQPCALRNVLRWRFAGVLLRGWGEETSQALQRRSACRADADHAT